MPSIPSDVSGREGKSPNKVYLRDRVRHRLRQSMSSAGALTAQAVPLRTALNHFGEGPCDRPDDPANVPLSTPRAAGSPGPDPWDCRSSSKAIRASLSRRTAAMYANWVTDEQKPRNAAIRSSASVDPPTPTSRPWSAGRCRPRLARRDITAAK